MVIQSEKNFSVKAETMRAIAEVNPMGTGLMLALSLRDRHTPDFKIPAMYSKILRQGFKGTIQDLYDAIEMLSDAGLGSIVYAKKGQGDDIFKWDYNLTHHCHKAFKKDFIEQAKTSGDYPEFYRRKDLKIEPKLRNVPTETKGLSFREVKNMQEKIPMKRGRGRPKGSKNKAEGYNEQKRETVSVGLTKIPSATTNDRLLSLPLKNKRDIKIQIPADVTKDELALLGLFLDEMTG